jgi:hypothetical protein
VWRPDVARRRPIGEILEKKKPAAMFARARYSLDDATMPVICPTSQIKQTVTKVVGQIARDIGYLRDGNNKARRRYLRRGRAMMSMCT